MRATALLATLGLCAVLAGPAVAEDVVKVGLIGPVSGLGATFGVPARNVVDILVKQVQAAGPINGHRIELVVADDQMNPTEAVRQATRLIRDAGVKAILSVGTASTTMAFMPLAAQAHVPVLASVATASVTLPSHAFFPWVFRVCPPAPLMAEQLLNLAVLKRGVKRVAVFYSQDAHGREEAEFEKDFIEKHPGVELVAYVGSSMDAIDLTTQATRIRDAQPEVVLLALSTTASAVSFARAAQQVGLKAQLAGDVLIAQKAFIDGAGPSAEGAYITAFSNWDDPLPKQAELGQTMRAAGMSPAGWSEILAAAGVQILAQALTTIDGPATGDSIRDSIEHIQKFNGTPLAGTVSYDKADHDGYGLDSVILVRIHDGKLETVR